MARIAFRNFLTKPATRRYPFVVREPFAGSRGRIAIDFPACIHCLACAKHCPADAILVDRDAKTWSIDRFACVICGACIRACPKKCLLMTNERPLALDFADSAGRIETHRSIAGPQDPAATPVAT
ncbi:MAG: 4Fe-4S dicluster domain-containing protein [Spirochaetota bacterium]